MKITFSRKIIHFLWFFIIIMHKSWKILINLFNFRQTFALKCENFHPIIAKSSLIFFSVSVDTQSSINRKERKFYHHTQMKRKTFSLTHTFSQHISEQKNNNNNNSTHDSRSLTQHNPDPFLSFLNFPFNFVCYMLTLCVYMST